MFIARTDDAVFHRDPTGKRSGLRLFIQNKLLLDPGRHHRIPQIDLMLHRIDQLGALCAWFTDLLQLRNHGDADIVFFQDNAGLRIRWIIAADNVRRVLHENIAAFL